MGRCDCPRERGARVAAICSRNESVLATRNVRDFDFMGIELESPFEYVSRAEGSAWSCGSRRVVELSCHMLS